MTVEIREIVIRATVSDLEKSDHWETMLASLKKEIAEECMAAMQEKLDHAADR
jgi:hypothetical protein